MSFTVTHPFDESDYPSDLRVLWRNLPEAVKAVLIDTGKRFGSLAIVQGVVSVLFAGDIQSLITGHIDGRYIQRIPPVYREVSGKLWIDADVLNYAAAMNRRPESWLTVPVPGTAFVCLSNVGDDTMVGVTLTGPEAAGVEVTGRAERVAPSEGLLLSFIPGLPRPREIAAEWVGDDGVPRSELVQLPPTCRAEGHAPQSMPSAIARGSAARTASASSNSNTRRSLTKA